MSGMSTLSSVAGYAKLIAVWFVRFYVLVLGAWGVGALLQGAWLFAAFGLAMPVLYFGFIVWRSYQQARKQPQKQVAG